MLLLRDFSGWLKNRGHHLLVDEGGFIVPLVMGIMAAYQAYQGTKDKNKNAGIDLQSRYAYDVLQNQQFDPNRVRKIMSRNMLAASLARAFGLEDSFGGREAMLALSDPTRLPGAQQEGVPGGMANLPGPEATGIPIGKRPSGLSQAILGGAGTFLGSGGLDQIAGGYGSGSGSSDPLLSSLDIDEELLGGL